eukprot:10805938-Alexandrium_andersonii.AAC.1
MSASLVGSEMCIRDRDRTAWQRVSILTVARPRQLERSGPGPVGDRCGGCLLYTSDAADDM